ncbi:M23 family metallopeptidase [Chryseobacterium potabilaquae]|uniref:Murein DD-endopeptidase MepM n=1 Tax=Chryseobacterium potabilaquae TaxID=2675057 RepID=A0A6N4X939_9FLAO|nr:M23 family metallopeptidase [Chryseobacterium potabilaquae]CAA7197315.1 Murein DD-endopeptidase MepM [Chryseobacterium potabilaquae]
MLSHKTSVHFVNAEGNGNKILIVPTFVLLYWKKFLFIISSILFILLVIIGVFIYQKTSDHYKEKLRKANYIKRQIDLQKLKKSFKSIDESIYRINQFMWQRDLENFQMKNIGGGEKLEIVDVNEVTSFYVDYINDLENVITKLPLGKPYMGTITSRFGTRANPFSGYGAESHSGIDFRGKSGDVVRSTAKGKVSFAGVKGGYGNCIIIDHDYHLQTLYGHLSSINVKKGEEVRIGSVIGKIGSTGRSTGPHLHYEVHFKGTRINPEQYLNLK